MNNDMIDVSTIDEAPGTRMIRADGLSGTDDQANLKLLRKFVIFDIDGCLSNDTARRRLITPHSHDDSAPKANVYKQYNAAAAGDAPMNVVEFRNATMLSTTVWKSAITPLFITARPKSMGDMTWAWLKKNFPMNEPHQVASPLLYMRPDDCEWHSPAIKARLLSEAMVREGFSPADVLAAYDDRIDVCEMYRAFGLPMIYLMDETGRHLFHRAATTRHEAQPQPASVPDILEKMAATFRERNVIYGDSFLRVGKMLAALFPNGVTLRTEQDFTRWQLLGLKASKLSRFANSGLSHVDSIHDDAVYSAIMEHVMPGSEPIQQGEKK